LDVHLNTIAIVPSPPAALGIPIDFVLFGLTLLGVAVFHRHTLRVALMGLATIAIYKIVFTGFDAGAGARGFVFHLGHEWVILANLLCLLMGFALLSRHFEKSLAMLLLPKYLPHDWKGGFVLLAAVWLLSSFLDNIAVASSAALLIFGIPAARQQHKYSPILKRARERPHVDWIRVGIVGLILTFAIATNVTVNVKFPEHSAHFPFIGVAVWVAILLSLVARRPDWEVLPETFKGSIFLLSLVVCASMMPVEELPLASWRTTLGLGFLSSVFDNIPLTALALEQGHYDWGVLGYAVGFGGSMIWFGSSAGVAISNMFPEARSVSAWVKAGWPIAVAYIVGFAALIMLLGWHPLPKDSSRGPSERTARFAGAEDGSWLLVSRRFEFIESLVRVGCVGRVPLHFIK